MGRLEQVKPDLKDRIIAALLWSCAGLTLLTTIGIIWSLGEDTWLFLERVPLTDFLFGTHWAPLIEPRSYGVLPLVAGTVLIVVGSGIVSVPLGTGIGIFLSEFASARTQRYLKPVLEILAGIPSVVYGYFALTTITPLLQRILPATQVFNALSASIVVGIMTLPMVASLTDDALRSLSTTLKQGGYALGATSFEVITQVQVPAAAPRILAAHVLSLSRAIGETMAVTLAAGATPNLTVNPLESIQTLTAYIVQVSMGDTPQDSLEYRTSIAVGMLLFLMTFVLNWLAHRVFRKPAPVAGV